MSKTGIYRIRHVDSGKCYVGSCASPQGFRVRWNNHTKNLRKNQHHSPHLQRAWNKYGADSFVFEILLYCDPKDCIMYEQIALDHYKPEYNVCPIAGNSLGYKHIDEDKARMSKIAKKRLQDPTRHPMYGKRGTKSPLFNASRRDGIMIGVKPLPRLAESETFHIGLYIEG